jgi:hypothetical protein
MDEDHASQTRIGVTHMYSSNFERAGSPCSQWISARSYNLKNMRLSCMQLQDFGTVKQVYHTRPMPSEVPYEVSKASEAVSELCLRLVPKYQTDGTTR